MESVRDDLDREMACEGVLECFYGLTGLDRETFGVLAETDDPLTVDQVAATIDRDRSTAYRSIQRLVAAGFVRREQVNYDDGGYYHVFEPAGADEVAEDLQRTLNDWYAQMGQLIGAFRETYADGTAATTGR